MRKKRKIDFILHENDYEKIIFRFYPRQSSCHSFGDEPPKDIDDVYKVYYYYKVIKIYKNDMSHVILFNSRCDECSIIDDMAARCKYLSEGKKKVTVTRGEDSWTVRLLNHEVLPFGDGVSWTLRESNNKKYYKFELFRTWDNVGFRFYLPKKRIKEFGEYLQECCDYMLAHGDPI